MAHRKQGYRFENDWTLERLETRTFQSVKEAITVPVDVEIEGEHLVLNLDNVKQILGKARTISIMDCNCRVERGHCDAPVNVCMDMNEIAERNIANGIAREITLDEALGVLEKTHEAGLVHMGLGQGEFYEPGVIKSVCSCCSCCCTVLSGILRFGLAPHLLQSQAVSVTDTSACTACGDCVDRCQFGAKEMVNGSLAHNPDLCFGCGLCVSTCPTKAITLVDK
uniref:4Fe-4S ferredoxin iron-sulfur binding domain protein n=1 Tax=uncultured marine crenarchaeote E6-3G TaxID=907719 RepID=G9BAM5_9ARCH|nr:4Fe-4S ferredoxin iron-sulfur binding domain protein [uncultured marine crenarchaeote E6-3G]